FPVAWAAPCPSRVTQPAAGSLVDVDEHVATMSVDLSGLTGAVVSWSPLEEPDTSSCKSQPR
ncbi:MAG: hypothetical protein KDA86_28385, partial [Planctomycetaceae bacterium]|nr:hypothetical protein [Planctomycetaceae bacterium]